MELQTTGGVKLRVYSSNELALAQPTFRKDDDGYLTIVAGSETELRKMLRNINRRDDKNLDVDAIVADNPIESHYSSDPIGFKFDCSGPLSDRAIVKSALALAFDAGIHSTQAELALAYLRNSRAEPCFYPYYSKDLVKNRTPGNALKLRITSPEIQRRVRYWGT